MSGSRPPPRRCAAAAGNTALKRDAADLELVYYAIGAQDAFGGVLPATRAMFDKYGIRHVFHPSDGGTLGSTGAATSTTSLRGCSGSARDHSISVRIAKASRVPPTNSIHDQ